MKGMTYLALLSLALVAIVGCASNNDSPSAESSKPSYFEDQKQSVNATVEAVDYKTRQLTLRGQNGRDLTFKASDDVRNLDQVKVGDRVSVDYYESLAIHVLAPGEAVNDVRTSLDRAEPGEKPGGMAAKHTTVTGVVEAVDQKNLRVKMRMSNGDVHTIQARDPKKVEQVKVGDRVQITYTETLAVGVTPATGAPATAPAAR